MTHHLDFQSAASSGAFSICRTMTKAKQHVLTIRKRPFEGTISIPCYTIHASTKGLPKSKEKGSRKGCKTRTRTKRTSVSEVYTQLGRNLFRRAYRMHYETFLHLYRIIKRQLFISMGYTTERTWAPKREYPINSHDIVFIK